MANKSETLIKAIQKLRKSYQSADPDKTKILVETQAALDMYYASKHEARSVGLNQGHLARLAGDLNFFERGWLRISWDTSYDKDEFIKLLKRDGSSEDQQKKLARILSEPVMALVFEHIANWMELASVNHWHEQCERVLTNARALNLAAVGVIPSPAVAPTAEARVAEPPRGGGAAGVAAAALAENPAPEAERAAAAPVALFPAGAAAADLLDLNIDAELDLPSNPSPYPLHPYPLDHTYAVLCEASYAKSLIKIRELLERECEEPGWELWKQFSVNKDRLLTEAPEARPDTFLGNVQRVVSTLKVAIRDLSEGAYMGFVFIHREKRHAVLVHQGDNFGNLATLKTTLENLMQPKVSFHQAASIAFTRRVIALCKTHGLTLSVSGHGLGGFLAHVTAFHCHDEWLDYPDIRVVSFDNPGFVSMSELLRPNVKEGGSSVVSLRKINSKTILSHPNLFNCIDLHYGTVCRMSPLLSGDWFKPFSVDAHDIGAIARCLKPIDEHSTESQARLRVYDWPTLDLSESLNTAGQVAQLPGILANPVGASLAGLKALWALTKVTLDSVKAFRKGELPTLVGGAQYQAFYNIYASAEGGYHPAPETEEARYLLKYNTHYHATDWDSQNIELRHFDSDMQEALIALHTSLRGESIELRVELEGDTHDIELLKLPAFTLSRTADEAPLIKLSGISSRRFYKAMLDLRRRCTELASDQMWLDFLAEKIEYADLLTRIQTKLKTLYQEDDYSQVRRTFARGDETALEPVKKMYVGLSILEDAEYRKREDESGSKSFVSGQLVPLESIFKTAQAAKKANRIFIEGGPGYGKTTACQYTVNRWAEGSLFPEFELLLWIPLREWEAKRDRDSSYSLNDFIKEKYLSGFPEIDNESLRAFFEKHKKKILWLLDGFDEVHTDKMRHKMIKHLKSAERIENWVLTSRPNYKEGIDYDLGLQITGFDTEHREEFIRRYFGLDPEISLNTTEVVSAAGGAGTGTATVTSSTPLEKASNLTALIKQNHQLLEMAQVPILLELFCFCFNSSSPDLVERVAKFKDGLRVSQLYAICIEELGRRFLVRSKRETEDSIKDLPLKRLHELTEAQQYFHEQLALSLAQTGNIYASPTLLAKTWHDTQLKLGLREADFNNILNYGLIRRLGKKEADKEEIGHTHFFIHRSLQEHYAAQTWIRNYFSGSPAEKSEALALFLDKKLDPSLRLVWQFVAGLLKTKEEAIEFFCLLTGEPLDYSANYGPGLLLACFDELSDTLLAELPGLTHQIQNYMQSLLNQGKVIQSVKAQQWLLTQFKEEWGIEKPSRRDPAILIALLKSLKAGEESTEEYWKAGLEHEHPEVAYLSAKKYLETDTAWSKEKEKMAFQLLAHRYKEVRVYATQKIKEKIPLIQAEHEEYLVAILSSEDLPREIHRKLLTCFIDFEYACSAREKAEDTADLGRFILNIRGFGEYTSLIITSLVKILENPVVDFYIKMKTAEILTKIGLFNLTATTKSRVEEILTKIDQFSLEALVKVNPSNLDSAIAALVKTLESLFENPAFDLSTRWIAREALIKIDPRNLKYASIPISQLALIFLTAEDDDEKEWMLIKLNSLGLKNKWLLDQTLKLFKSNLLSYINICSSLYDTPVTIHCHCRYQASRKRINSTLLNYLNGTKLWYHGQDYWLLLKTKIVHGGLVPGMVDQLENGNMELLIQKAAALGVNIILSNFARETLDFVDDSRNRALVTHARVAAVKSEKAGMLVVRLKNRSLSIEEKSELLRYLALTKINADLINFLVTWVDTVGIDLGLRHQALSILADWYCQEEERALNYLHGAALLLNLQSLTITAENKLIWRFNNKSYSWELTPALKSKILREINAESRALGILNIKPFKSEDLVKLSLAATELRLKLDLEQQWLTRLTQMQYRFLYLNYDDLMGLVTEISENRMLLSDMARLGKIKNSVLVLLLAIFFYRESFFYRGFRTQLPALKKQLIENQIVVLTQLAFLNIARDLWGRMIGSEAESYTKAKKILECLALQVANPEQDGLYEIAGFDKEQAEAKSLCAAKKEARIRAYPIISTLPATEAAVEPIVPVVATSAATITYPSLFHRGTSLMPAESLLPRLKKLMHQLGSVDAETIFYQRFYGQDKALTQKLQTRFGIKRKIIDGDGHCQFRAMASELLRLHPEGFPRALAAQLSDRSLAALTLKLREIAVDYIKDHREEFIGFFSADSHESNGCDSFDTYLTEMRNTKAYGGEMTLRALTRALSQTVVILRPSSESETEFEFGHHIYSSSVDGNACDLQAFACLIYNGFNHYDTVEETPDLRLTIYLHNYLTPVDSHGAVECKW